MTFFENDNGAHIKKKKKNQLIFKIKNKKRFKNPDRIGFVLDSPRVSPATGVSGMSTGQRPQGRPMNHWRNHILQLAWEHLERSWNL